MNDRYVVLTFDRREVSKEQTDEGLLDYIKENPHMMNFPLYVDISIRAFGQERRVVARVIGRTEYNFIIDKNPYPEHETCSLTVNYFEDKYTWYGEALVSKRYPEFMPTYRYQDFIHQVFFKKEDMKNKLMKRALSKGDIL